LFEWPLGYALCARPSRARDNQVESVMKFGPGPQKYAQSIFLRDRALEMVHRHGTVVRIGNAGIGKECARTGFCVFYSDPETAECDEPALYRVSPSPPPPTAYRFSISFPAPSAVKDEPKILSPQSHRVVQLVLTGNTFISCSFFCRGHQRNFKFKSHWEFS